MKTVKEYIEEQKSKITLNEIVSSLESIADYARDTYGHDLSEKYQGNHTLEDDPWLKDIIASEKAVEIIKAMIPKVPAEITLKVTCGRCRHCSYVYEGKKIIGATCPYGEPDLKSDSVVEDCRHFRTF